MRLALSPLGTMQAERKSDRGREGERGGWRDREKTTAVCVAWPQSRWMKLKLSLIPFLQRCLHQDTVQEQVTVPLFSLFFLSWGGFCGVGSGTGYALEPVLGARVAATRCTPRPVCPLHFPYCPLIIWWAPTALLQATCASPTSALTLGLIAPH